MTIVDRYIYRKKKAKYKIGKTYSFPNKLNRWKLEETHETSIDTTPTGKPTGKPTFVYGFSRVGKGGRKMEQHQVKHIRHSKRGKAFVAGRKWGGYKARIEKYNIEFLESGYNGDYQYWRFKIDGDDVEVDAPSLSLDRNYWSVIWGDAVDFDGNKTEMLKRYPELRQAFLHNTAFQ